LQETILGLGNVILPSSDLPDNGDDEDKEFLRTLDEQEHKLEEKLVNNENNEEKLEKRLEHHDKRENQFVKTKFSKSEIVHEVAEKKLRFILWGMTLGITVDFLNLVNVDGSKKLILPEPNVNNQFVNFIFRIVVSLFGYKGANAMHGIKIAVSIFVSILVVFTFLLLINLYPKQK